MNQPSLQTNLIRSGVIASLCIIVYFNSLMGPFQYDDKEALSRSWVASISAFSNEVSWLEVANRPALIFSFALNKELGGNQTLGFHLVNLFLHCAIAILTLSLLLRIRRLRALAGFAMHPAIPFGAALLFAVHPLHSDSVSYISSRSTLLATFFYLLSLLAFFRLFSTERAGRSRPIIALCGLLIFAYLAVASKLIAATLPIACFFLFVFIIGPRWRPRLAAQLSQPKCIAAYIALALGALAFALFVPESIYAPRDQGSQFFSRADYLWMQIEIIALFYAKLVFLPFNLNVDIGYPLAASLPNWNSLIALSVLLSLAWFAWQRKDFWIGAGLIWFVTALAPTSSVIPLSDLAVEHRTYLPMTLGFTMVVVSLLNGGGRRAFVFLLPVALIFSLLTAERNRAWTSEEALWKDAALKTPHSPRTHNNLGRVYYDQGDARKAQEHFLQAIQNIELSNRQRGFDIAEPHYNIASLYLDLNQLNDSQKEYEITLSIQPENFKAHLGLGSVYNRKGDLTKALEQFDRALELRQAQAPGRDYPLARINRGEVFGKTGRFEEAVREFEIAIEFDPSSHVAHHNLGVANMALTRFEKAERAFLEALRLKPGFAPSSAGLKDARLQSQRKNATHP
ncbi:MAG: tetratricopeptide repeat protein [Candidatus Nitrohelix vancouverensis]|uniref:Tetratricopeptide repeat protein n=1 Tax=Candidatus Nitrohelix vancouverensis TaxID=2705534 RepID=A0A7T0BZX8_9BACT|nr:MAG: tetratricopeptide repeat protein [Candidatus Nitrohelix vancouverensis]